MNIFILYYYISIFFCLTSIFILYYIIYEYFFVLLVFLYYIIYEYFYIILLFMNTFILYNMNIFFVLWIFIYYIIIYDILVNILIIIFRIYLIRILRHLITFPWICPYCDSKKNMLLKIYGKVMKDYWDPKDMQFGY